MGFHTTHWTVVLQAKADQGSGAQEALASLCSTYWYPLYAFVRRQGSSPPEAEDLIQEFFCPVLQRQWLVNVSPAAGKFRSFLLACLKNFVTNERERAKTQRRGGGRKILPLDGETAETRYALEPVTRITPEVLFERRWALALVERTLGELQREYTRAGKGGWFDELQQFLPGGEGNLSRAELAVKRGVTTGAIDVTVHRLRQRFGAILREQVAQTVSSAAEVEEEIRYLMAVLSG